MQRNIVILSILIFISLVAFLISQHDDVNAKNIKKLLKYLNPSRVKNPLDGCLHVYLDMGSNRGVQIRKLYEPQYYKDAGILPIFDQYFGTIGERNLTEICTVGFEGAQPYAEELEAINQAYRNCGWNVNIRTSTGVGIRDSQGIFVYNGLGGHFAEGNERKDQPVAQMVSIANFVNQIVATRELPYTEKYHTPRVLMKLDVEGLEREIIPDFFMSGAAGHVDYMYVDFHLWDWQTKHFKEVIKLKEAVDRLMDLAHQAGLSHILEVSSLDDETYGDDKSPLPNCNATKL